jgi:hypothetical protein
VAVLIFDTETIGTTDKSVYEIAWLVFDGRVVREHRSFLIEEVFCDPARMSGAFFKNLVFSEYMPRLSSGQMILAPFGKVRDQWHADLISHKVSRILAYNIGFDFAALRYTAQSIGDRAKFSRWAMPYACLWANACLILGASKHYRTFCLANNFVSAKGNLLTNAETMLRFVLDDPDVTVPHVAQDDVLAELAIYRAIRSRKRSMLLDCAPRNPWAFVNNRVAS